jgi:hypothetical protein
MERMVPLDLLHYGLYLGTPGITYCDFRLPALSLVYSDRLAETGRSLDRALRINSRGSVRPV